MKEGNDIRYVTKGGIDKIKWDACIDKAENGLIYGYSGYLDMMANYWDALILNDYEVVMPLTWNKKYGIYYLYQPFFTACLGLFGNNITADLVNDFLHAIPAKFKYWDFSLNYANRFHLKNFELYDRVNYVLALNESYEKLYAGFRLNLKRNLKKAEQLNCIVHKNIDIDEVIALAKDQAKKFSPAKKEDYGRFKNLYNQLYSRQKAITYGVYLLPGQLVASCVLFFSHSRAYYILVGNHPDGKTIGASHTLINTFIKEHAGQDLLLDFEGSDIRSLAFFYSSFGAITEMYVGIKLNKLPSILQLLKP
ncbi:MAG: GNAT family N-acetyltransferase [Ferruginibacter sp.]|nr:GNAT family N-acetyltransferase [Ferruginibacter sp.]